MGENEAVAGRVTEHSCQNRPQRTENDAEICFGRRQFVDSGGPAVNPPTIASLNSLTSFDSLDNDGPHPAAGEDCRKLPIVTINR